MFRLRSLAIATSASLSYAGRASCDHRSGESSNVSKSSDEPSTGSGKIAAGEAPKAQKFMGPYCHECEKDGKDWSTLKYKPTIISSDMSQDDMWNVFMGQSVCGNYWRLWSQTREAVRGEDGRLEDNNSTSEEALKVASDALKSCMKRNKAYYETVHDEEVEEADPLPPGPKLDPEEDWSDLSEDEPTGCSLCIFMRGSPCGNHFRRWDKCVKANPEDYTKTCFDVSKKMFECNNSVEFKAFQEADKHNKNARKERKDKVPSPHSRQDMLTTMRWELNSIIKSSPSLIPSSAIDFGDEFRVDLRHILDDEGYSQGQHGSWAPGPGGLRNPGDPVTHCYVKDRQNNLLGFA
ncbi:hypothetical protein TrRE_jg2643, partial [Triparma retinervis]